MAVDMRQPSRSGLDLAGKSFAVVYLQNGDEKTGEFNANFANGFAEKLEDEYFGGHRKVALYSIAQQEGAKYASKDTLVNLVMDLNADVIFLVDMPAFGTQESEEVPFHVNVFAYDSMNQIRSMPIPVPTRSRPRIGKPLATKPVTRRATFSRLSGRPNASA